MTALTPRMMMVVLLLQFSLFVYATADMNGNSFLEQMGFNQMVVEMLSHMGVPKAQHDDIVQEAALLMAEKMDAEFSPTQLQDILDRPKSDTSDNTFAQWFTSQFVAVLNQAFRTHNNTEGSGDNDVRIESPGMMPDGF